jgi:hypothetical protein
MANQSEKIEASAGQAKTPIRFKFWSDTNYSHFLSSLDYRMASNLWAKDDAISTVWFSEPPPGQVVRHARSLGADIIGV